jgi:SAM-dependent methyltransferase
VTERGPDLPAARCPLCGAAGSRASFRQGGFGFRDCRACRTLFVDRLPGQDELTTFYVEPDADRGSTFCWDVETRHDVSSFDRALEAADPGGDHGPVLDVGCGAGPFLAHARDRGWSDLTGLELSPPAAELARHRSGAQILETTLDADLPRDHYAIVAMWDVLEHLREPRLALQRVHELLRPGGVVAVSTPNRFGLALWVFGGHSVVVCPPEHLLVASRRGVSAALHDAGFDVTGIWSEDLRVREWTRVLSRAKDSESGRQSYHDVQGRLTTSWWFETARACANIGLRATRLGDQLLAVAARARR